MVKKCERYARVRNEKNIAAPDLKVNSNVALLDKTNVNLSMTNVH